MKCLRCGHIQNDTYQCENCSFIFNKKQSRVGQEHEHFLHTNVGRLVIGALIVGILIICLPGRQSQQKSEPISAAAVDVDVQPTAAKIDANKKIKTAKHNLAKQLQLTSPPKNNIERARNATVVIKTSWGFGSGFFISSDCKILTNKHVVEYDKEKLATLETGMQLQQAAIAAEERELAARKAKFQQECQDCSRESFDQYVGTLSDNYYAAKDKIASTRQKLTELKYLQEYKIQLVDGSEYTVGDVITSQNHDLALLSLRKSVCPFVTPADNIYNLTHGDTVFTIGSPRGVSHTVTAGVFSGYQRMAMHRYIQTDAPINPGNSGGPLINHFGRVIGVNTLMAENIAGIGFAIPIDLALSEFNISSE